MADDVLELTQEQFDAFNAKETEFLSTLEKDTDGTPLVSQGDLDNFHQYALGQVTNPAGAYPGMSTADRESRIADIETQKGPLEAETTPEKIAGYTAAAPWEQMGEGISGLLGAGFGASGGGAVGTATVPVPVLGTALGAGFGGAYGFIKGEQGARAAAEKAGLAPNMGLMDDDRSMLGKINDTVGIPAERSEEFLKMGALGTALPIAAGGIAGAGIQGAKEIGSLFKNSLKGPADPALQEPGIKAALDYAMRDNRLRKMPDRVTPGVQDVLRTIQQEAERVPDYIKSNLNAGSSKAVDDIALNVRASQKLKKIIGSGIFQRVKSVQQLHDEVAGSFDEATGQEIPGLLDKIIDNQRAVAERLDADILSANKKLNRGRPGKNIGEFQMDPNGETSFAPGYTIWKNEISPSDLSVEITTLADRARDLGKSSLTKDIGQKLLNTTETLINDMGPVVGEGGERYILTPSRALVLIRNMNLYRRAVGEFKNSNIVREMKGDMTQLAQVDASLEAISTMQRGLTDAMDRVAHKVDPKLGPRFFSDSQGEYGAYEVVKDMAKNSMVANDRMRIPYTDTEPTGRMQYPTSKTGVVGRVADHFFPDDSATKSQMRAAGAIKGETAPVQNIQDLMQFNSEPYQIPPISEGLMPRMQASAGRMGGAVGTGLRESVDMMRPSLAGAAAAPFAGGQSPQQPPSMYEGGGSGGGGGGPAAPGFSPDGIMANPMQAPYPPALPRDPRQVDNRFIAAFLERSGGDPVSTQLVTTLAQAIQARDKQKIEATLEGMTMIHPQLFEAGWGINGKIRNKTIQSQYLSTVRGKLPLAQIARQESAFNDPNNLAILPPEAADPGLKREAPVRNEPNGNGTASYAY